MQFFSSFNIGSVTYNSGQIENFI